MDKRKDRGAISVYAALSLFLMIAMFCVMLESARTKAVQAYVQYAMASASDTMLGAYCRELFDSYGLLFFDGSYHTDGLLVTEMEYEWAHYFQDYESQPGDLGVNLLHFQTQNIRIADVKTAVDDQGRYFIDSVYEQMKYNNLGEGIGRWKEILQSLSDALSQEDELREQIASIKEETEQLKAEPEQYIENQQAGQANVQKAELSKKILRSREEKRNNATVQSEETGWLALEEFDIYDESRTEEWKTMVAVLIYPAFWDFSMQEVDMDHPPSEFVDMHDRQDMILSMDEIEELFVDGEESLKHLFLVQYAFSHFSCYTAGKEETPEDLEYELEYILVGSTNEYDNFVDVVNLLLVMRTVCNCVHILRCDDKMNVLEQASKTVFAFTMNEAIMEAGKYVLLYLWAYVEGIADVRALLEGEEFCFIKEEDEWKTDLDGMVKNYTKNGFSGMVTALLSGELNNIQNTGNIGISNEDVAGEDIIADGQSEDSEGMKLGYEDYLFLLFLLQDTELVAYRTMDIIQLRMGQEYENFMMKNMVYGFIVEAEIKCYGIFYRTREEDEGLGFFPSLYPRMTIRDYRCYS